MRVISRATKPKEAFPKIFIIVRLILLVPVCMTMFTSFAWYGEQLNLPHNRGFGYSHGSGTLVSQQVTKVALNLIESELQKENLSEHERTDLTMAKNKLVGHAESRIDENLVDISGVALTQSDNNEKNTPRSVRIDETSAKSDFLDNLIASFVYNYEAFEHSHCQKDPDERVVYISENDILVVKVDIGSTTEYAFSTRSCVVSN